MRIGRFGQFCADVCADALPMLVEMTTSAPSARTRDFISVFPSRMCGLRGALRRSGQPQLCLLFPALGCAGLMQRMLHQAGAGWEGGCVVMRAERRWPDFSARHGRA